MLKCLLILSHHVDLPDSASHFQCMFQSWYLAADTQLFILAPLVLYPMWKYRKFGFVLITTLTFVSIVIPLFITYANDYDPSLLPYAE